MLLLTNAHMNILLSVDSFQRYIRNCYCSFIKKKMICEEREALFATSTKKFVKTMVNYFKKQNVPQSMRDYRLKKYLQNRSSKDLS